MQPCPPAKPAPSRDGLFIVEDSIPVRERLVRTLEGLEGLDIVGTAEDVTAAIAGLETTPPDALILDLQLPSGSGLQVLRAVREKLARHARHRHDQLRRRALPQGRHGRRRGDLPGQVGEFGRVRDILREWRDEENNRPCTDSTMPTRKETAMSTVRATSHAMPIDQPSPKPAGCCACRKSPARARSTRPSCTGA